MTKSCGSHNPCHKGTNQVALERWSLRCGSHMLLEPDLCPVLSVSWAAPHWAGGLKGGKAHARWLVLTSLHAQNSGSCHFPQKTQGLEIAGCLTFLCILQNTIKPGPLQEALLDYLCSRHLTGPKYHPSCSLSTAESCPPEAGSFQLAREKPHPHAAPSEQML